MNFHNGIPITVVSGMQRMLTPLDTSRRRLAEADASRKAT